MGGAVGQGRRSARSTLLPVLLLLPMLGVHGVAPDGRTHTLLSLIRSLPAAWNREADGFACLQLGGKKARVASAHGSAHSDPGSTLSWGRAEPPSSVEPGEPASMTPLPLHPLKAENVVRYRGALGSALVARWNLAELKRHCGMPGDEARGAAPTDSLRRLTC